MRKFLSLILILFCVSCDSKQDTQNNGTRPPLQFTIYCLKYGDCKPSDTLSIELTPATKATLYSVNYYINHLIKPKLDKDDIWTLSPKEGDCEDYSLTKRHMLIQLGIPAGALRMTIVVTDKGVGHAVLTVVTDKGEYVLDNLTNEVKNWNMIKYKRIAMQQTSPTDWRWY